MKINISFEEFLKTDFEEQLYDMLLDEYEIDL